MERSIGSIIHENYNTKGNIYKTYFVYGNNMYRTFDKWILNHPGQVRIVKRDIFTFRLSGNCWDRKVEAKLSHQDDSKYEPVFMESYLH